MKIIRNLPHLFSLYLVTAVWVLHFLAGQRTGASGSWNRRAADKFDSRLHSTHTLATKQPWLKSSGLQDLVSYARTGLSKPNWRCWWVARAHQSSVGELDQRIIDTAVRQWRTRRHACVKAKGDHFEHKLPWLNDEMPDKLFNRNILTICFITIFEFLIKCVVSHIAHDIHDRVELVTHCFSQYCDSKVWNFCCMWRSISWYMSRWNCIKLCYLQWKLYTKKT